MIDLIKDWRAHFQSGTFPFLQVQLANFGKEADLQPDSTWAPLREAQLKALELPNTGLAVTIDVGEADNIHPIDKRTVGHRLAQWALTQVYGQTGTPGSPLYKGCRTEGQSVRVFFENARDGLSLREGHSVQTLFITDDECEWKPAQSRIEGATLVVWHDEIAQPTNVCYAWAGNPAKANLVNVAGYPASPFRTT